MGELGSQEFCQSKAHPRFSNAFRYKLYTSSAAIWPEFHCQNYNYASSNSTPVKKNLGWTLEVESDTNRNVGSTPYSTSIHIVYLAKLGSPNPLKIKTKQWQTQHKFALRHIRKSVWAESRPANAPQSPQNGESKYSQSQPRCGRWSKTLY